MAIGNSLNLPELASNGDLWIGNGTTVPAAATLIAGSNVIITNGSGTITIAATTGFAPFTNVTGTTQAMTTNNGYFADNASTQIAFTLPTTSAVGDVLYLLGVGAAGWQITYTTGQSIQVGNHTSTATTGSVTNTLASDCIEMRCQVANTFWVANAVQGNLTVV